MRRVQWSVAWVVLLSGAVSAQDLAPQAREGLLQAVTYLRAKVAYGGGYLGSYTADLSDQWGETHATRTQNWIQPPGCPAVGMAFLKAWEATGEAVYLEAAREVGHSLVAGQLECGGWDYIVDHDPAAAKKWFYRRNRDSANPELRQGANRATLDDNVTQAATQLLMALDKALEQKDAPLHEAVLAALEFFLKAQHSSGGWPQRFPLTGKGYSDYLTFNDNTIADCVGVMRAAFRQYGDERYRDSVRRCGDFILRVQLPAPQSIWAQQYDLELKPAGARKFEPPAACAYESVGVMQTLLQIAVFLDEAKYAAALGPALEWYRRSALPDGKFARFYELGTNRPLYFTKDYKLTYDDSDLPTHYSFKGMGYPRSVESRYRELQQVGLVAYARSQEPRPLTPEQRSKQIAELAPRVKAALEARDAEGRWVTEGKLEMSVWGRNMGLLADYLRLIHGR